MNFIKPVFVFFIAALISFLLTNCSYKFAQQVNEKHNDNLLTYNENPFNLKNDNQIDSSEIFIKSENQKKVINEIRDSIYDNDIHTVILHKTGWIFSLPIIKFNSDETLNLSFDDFNQEVKKFKFTYQICDAYWQELKTPIYQYIEGFAEDYLNHYKLSFNTIQNYIHYELQFPNSTMKITKSGNYLLKIYIDESENPIIVKRFMVLENTINIDAKIKDATLLSEKKYRQEIDFSIISNDFIIENPSQNLIVNIYQNMRPDNAIINLKPRIVKGNIFDFDYDNGENVFNGGNEFRNFDIKSLKYNSERIKYISYENKMNHVFLYNDLPRPFKVYKTEDDINGKYAIKSDYTKNYDNEADYTWVYFSLPYEIPTVEGNIYIYGYLTEWKLSNDALMKYNYKHRSYETALYLKQGYYNYQYILQKNGQSEFDETFIEGNHSETENDYFIFVYYRQPGELYDKFIGFRQINSINNRQ